METLYVWLFIFVGATMIVEGISLLTSERSLENNDVKSTCSDAITGPPSLKASKHIDRRNY